MRTWLLTALVIAAAPAEAGLWTAACQDQQIQYQQITGAEGYLHAATGNGGSYTTVKLKESFLSSKMVCGSVPAKVGANDIATVCADSEHQTIRILRGSDLAKGVKPEKAPVFCQAVVNAN